MAMPAAMAEGAHRGLACPEVRTSQSPAQASPEDGVPEQASVAAVAEAPPPLWPEAADIRERAFAALDGRDLGSSSLRSFRQDLPRVSTLRVALFGRGVDL